MLINYEKNGRRRTMEVDEAVIINELDNGSEIHVNFTHQGIITDVVEGGDVVDTRSATYEEIAEDMVAHGR